ncbi:MAG: GNAT family N-acetyltransferase, partial [Alphaproteobacteria bacterium]|nr:GNAT family N-acetyltransferase [Alphaproteobacteria bacterium]
MTTVKTQRLTLRPLVPGDAEAYAAMRFHPDIAKWLPPASGDPVAAARASIARFAAGWQERRHAPWGVF